MNANIPQSFRPPAPSRADRAERTETLLLRLSQTTDESQRATLMDQVVLINMGVAEAVVSRYRGRGIPEEDLQQVAYMALVRAVQHYDHSTGNNFLSYCVPTVRGEIRRYFRDQGWMVRPPRRIQELQQRVFRAQEELTFRLGRVPLQREIADEVDSTPEEVSEAMAGNGCFTPVSLDRPVGEDSSVSIGDLLGADQDDRGAAEARLVLGPVVRRLSERDRRILMLRFFRGLTQQEIADDIGVTQMQVSRLLSRIYEDLRTSLFAEPERARLTSGPEQPRGAGRQCRRVVLETVPRIVPINSGARCRATSA
ncbi:MAG: sigma-70 family RNA polymerase sigma factor [Marmoricola sp.]